MSSQQHIRKLRAACMLIQHRTTLAASIEMSISHTHICQLPQTRRQAMQESSKPALREALCEVYVTNKLNCNKVYTRTIVPDLKYGALLIHLRACDFTQEHRRPGETPEPWPPPSDVKRRLRTKQFRAPLLSCCWDIFPTSHCFFLRPLSACNVLV